MSGETLFGEGSSEPSLFFQRLIPAEMERVFEAWTDPAMLAQWFGPADAECEVSQNAALVGEGMLIEMRINGGRYPIHATYLDIDSPYEISWLWSVDQHPQDWKDFFISMLPDSSVVPTWKLTTHVAIDFHVDGTDLLVTQTFDSFAERDAIVAMGTEAGWSESLERLARMLTVRN